MPGADILVEGLQKDGTVVLSNNSHEMAALQKQLADSMGGRFIEVRGFSFGYQLVYKFSNYTAAWMYETALGRANAYIGLKRREVPKYLLK
jgi:hypothetical protein